MEYQIKNSQTLLLAGLCIETCLTENHIPELWQQFMTRLKEIENRIGEELYSVEVYPDQMFFDNFNPNRKFHKWAAVRIAADNNLPSEMQSLNIPEGLYAVFPYNGSAEGAPRFYSMIYGQWLPESDFVLDDRPHFAIMPVNYRPDDPESEEEIWIPVIRK